MITLYLVAQLGDDVRAITYKEIEALLTDMQKEISTAVCNGNKFALCAIAERLDELLKALAQWYLRQQRGPMTDFHLDSLRTHIEVARWEAVLAAEKVHPSDISL